MEDKVLDASLGTQSLIKLSASSTKTYEQCPAKFNYTYNIKLPRKEWPHLDLGSLCHAILEQFHKEWLQDKNLDLVMLMGKCFSKQRQAYPNLSIELVESAKDMMQRYLSGVEKNGMPVTLSVEESFTIVVDKYLLRGFIDRIDLDPDNIFHIVDYKTSKTEKYLDNFQLLVYGMALKNKYPDLDRFRGSYILLKQGSKWMTEEFCIDDVIKCEQKIIKYGQSIENEQVWEKRPSNLCNWCDFFDPCQGGWV